MREQATRFLGNPPTVLGAVLACGAALALSACGGSSDSSSPATTAAGQGEATTTAAQPKQGQGGDSGAKTDSGSSGGSSPASAGAGVTALKVSGGGSAQFRVKGGGDNSVQEFGEEGDEGQLREAAELVHEFYADRATGDWKGACAVLSRSLLKQLEKLAAQSPEGKGTDCPTFLASFTAKLSPAEWRQITTVDAGSLRYEGEQAFLIYYGPERTVYAMPMVSEGGGWKVSALSSAQLPGT